MIINDQYDVNKVIREYFIKEYGEGCEPYIKYLIKRFDYSVSYYPDKVCLTRDGKEVCALLDTETHSEFVLGGIYHGFFKYKGR